MPENVKQVVPFLRVSSIERSIPFYDALGFTMKRKWEPNGKLRWCWLTLGGASLMLQDFAKPPDSKVGVGVTLAFQCEDAVALYRDFTLRGLALSEPQVGNSMWVTCLTDPDGYRLEFESPTNVPEETKLSELEAGSTS